MTSSAIFRDRMRSCAGEEGSEGGAITENGDAEINSDGGPGTDPGGDLGDVGRRLADREVVRRLRPGYSGPEWTAFAERLARYGLGVMDAWLATGEIFTRCRQKGCPCGPVPAGWTRQDRTDLSSDTVGAALPLFRRRALVEGRWDPDGGATLSSYFIGTCIYTFPNVLRRWRAGQRLGAPEEPVEPGSAALIQLPGSADVEAHVVNRLAVEEAIAAIADPRTRTAVLLQAEGYSLVEIAELLSAGADATVTVRAVEGLLRRHRHGTRRSTGTDGRTS